MPHNVLSTGAMARLCGLSKHTILEAIERGELPAHQTPGGHNRICRDDAIAYMQQRRLAGAVEPVQRVLVVAEGELVFDMLTEMLDKRRCQVQHAAQAYSAGRKVETWFPSLIVLDAPVPGCPAVAVAEHMQSLPSYGSWLLVLAPQAKVRRCQKELPQDKCFVLGKPFKAQALREKVQTILAAMESLSAHR